MFYVAQIYTIVSEEFVHWNKIVNRRMKPITSLDLPWKVQFARNMPQEVLDFLKLIALKRNYGIVAKKTRCVEHLKLTAVTTWMLYVINKTNYPCCCFVILAKWGTISPYQLLRSCAAGLEIATLHCLMGLFYWIVSRPPKQPHDAMVNGNVEVANSNPKVISWKTSKTLNKDLDPNDSSFNIYISTNRNICYIF